MQAITEHFTTSQSKTNPIVSINLHQGKAKGVALVSAQIKNDVQFSIGYSVDVVFVNTDTGDELQTVPLLHMIGSDLLLPYSFVVEVPRCSVQLRANGGTLSGFITVLFPINLSGSKVKVDGNPDAEMREEPTVSLASMRSAVVPELAPLSAGNAEVRNVEPNQTNIVPIYRRSRSRPTMSDRNPLNSVIPATNNNVVRIL